MSSERIALFGAGGRMGQAIIAAGAGKDFSQLHAGSDFTVLDSCAVAIDFTTPDACMIHARECTLRGLSLVIGTTGLNAEQYIVLKDCAKKIPIVYSANMSLGVNLLAALAEQAAAKLGMEYDIEILEMHHRRKIDAPSGTALLLGNAAAKGRGKALADLRAGDDRTSQRETGRIGFASLRGGDVAGDHTVIFAGEGERLELTHRASNRTVFAQGALRAADWIIGKPVGLYGMNDVLGLT